MQSFRDPATGVLKAYGFAASNAPGDLAQAEADDFALEPGKWKLAAGAWVGNLPTLADNIAAAVLKIDADADAIRHDVLGFRTTEYQMALSDAQAFQTAGFVGTAPPGVDSWVKAKNDVGALTAAGLPWTAQDAAQDILNTGASWKSAEESIRSNRLLRKEQAKVAATQAILDTALANWAGFVSAIRKQLGLPPA